jgi:hypothetical protein
MSKREQELYNALIAIRARINGEFDNPELNKFGALSTDKIEDILLIVDYTFYSLSKLNHEQSKN